MRRNCVLPLIQGPRKMLPTRILGNTGLSVTQIGYGSMGLRGPKTWGIRVVEESDAETFLHRVLDSGINFIDTSPDYGLCEERIGRYLSHRRGEFYLATKCGCVYTQHPDHLEIDHHWDAAVIQSNLETSLRRLRTDHLDLLQFHGGDIETLRRNGLIELLQSFREKGLIRFIGVSSKLPNLSGLIEAQVFDTFQIPYSCLAAEHHDLIHQAGTQGAGVIIRGGIAQGGPEATIQRPLLNEVWDAASLDQFLDGSMTRAQLILRFTLSHPHCHTTIVGTCNEAHLMENIAAAEAGPLPEDLYRSIWTQLSKFHDGKASG